MIESRFRAIYQRLIIEPILPWLAWCTPLWLTAFAGFAGILFVPLAVARYKLLAVTALLISGFLDTLDGSLARAQARQTPLGSVLDIVVDRFVEFCAVLGLFLIEPTERALPCIAMLGAMLLCVTSFLVVGIFSENDGDKGFHYSAGLMERAEAFIFFILMIVLPAYFQLAAWAFVLLVTITAIQRLLTFSKYHAIV